LAGIAGGAHMQKNASHCRKLTGKRGEHDNGS
jgi:hypothetical protein